MLPHLHSKSCGSLPTSTQLRPCLKYPTCHMSPRLPSKILDWKATALYRTALFRSWYLFLSRALSLSLALSTSLELSRTLSNSLELSRPLSNSLELTRPLSTSLDLSRTLSNSLDLSRPLSNSLELSRTHSNSLDLSRTLSNSLELSPTQQRGTSRRGGPRPRWPARSDGVARHDSLSLVLSCLPRTQPKWAAPMGVRHWVRWSETCAQCSMEISHLALALSLSLSLCKYTYAYLHILLSLCTDTCLHLSCEEELLLYHSMPGCSLGGALSANLHEMRIHKRNLLHSHPPPPPVFDNRSSDWVGPSQEGGALPRPRGVVLGLGMALGP